MIENLIIFGLIAFVLYFAFMRDDWDVYHIKKYDDRVIEFINGHFTLVDKR